MTGHELAKLHRHKGRQGSRTDLRHPDPPPTCLVTGCRREVVAWISPERGACSVHEPLLAQDLQARDWARTSEHDQDGVYAEFLPERSWDWHRKERIDTCPDGKPRG